MGKTRNTTDREWASRIIALRRRMGVSQTELGKQLNSSAMAISRWERGAQEPPANIYIQLGNITGDPECWYFWGRAGLHSGDLMRVLPAVRTRLQKERLPAFQIVQPETVLAAPSSWCPNPAYTSCLRVRGRSMMPLLHDGYIIVVDKSQTNRRKLYGQIVVAAHKEQGLIVSRLQRFDDTEVLVPENREYDSISISSASWRIVAKILWWIGRASQAAS